jgi:hypothetical protein
MPVTRVSVSAIFCASICINMKEFGSFFDAWLVRRHFCCVLCAVLAEALSIVVMVTACVLCEVIMEGKNYGTFNVLVINNEVHQFYDFLNSCRCVR